MAHIIKNAIQYRDCGDIIESTSHYDFVTCSCGCYSVAGGHDYLRRDFRQSRDDFIELSRYEEEPSGER